MKMWAANVGRAWLAVGRCGQIVAICSLLIFCPSWSLAACPSSSSTAPVDLSHIYSDGWGYGTANRRFQADTSINRDNLGALQLAWAVSLGKKADHHAMPLVTTNTVFIGTEDGTLLALDRETGCERYVRQFDGSIRTAIIHHEVSIKGQVETLLYFGTITGSVYAITASAGDVRWHVQADVHAFTRITGTPTIFEDTVYIPVSSSEAGVAAGPTYSCCTFRGSILAVDAASGERRWRSYSIPEPARITGTRLLLIKERGPSGAPVWLAPTINPDLGLLYYGTGENYSLPATLTSDAILAISLKDGAVVWSRQFTANDVWNISCDLPLISPNCPDKELGVDLDFGASPILATAKRRGPILLAGQKSGVVYAQNPATGELLWERRVGRGGKLGGIHWGMAVNEGQNLLFVPISDRMAEGSFPARPGLHALDLDTGEVAWSTLHTGGCTGDLGCESGISAAVTATPGLVFAGALDGMLRAYDETDGKVLWSYQTDTELTSVSGEVVTGGAIDVHGPMVAGDMLFVTSGYGMFLQKSGNAFLAFRIKPGASMK